MRIMKNLWSAALFALPVLAGAQRPSAVKPPFEVMQANVAEIKNYAEKERWMANVDLWKLALAQPARYSEEDSTRMEALLERIRYNVARIRNTPEKDRWETNIRLWRVLIDARGAVTKAVAARIQPDIQALATNIAGIDITAEHERWQANRELWETVASRTIAAF
ncbi:MAG: hypothetical protein KGL93_10480 [Gemmatimonadota bacterium]|nr:hypothetical protein [Gemmatimonadota bacterium]